MHLLSNMAKIILNFLGRFKIIQQFNIIQLLNCHCKPLGLATSTRPSWKSWPSGLPHRVRVPLLPPGARRWAQLWAHSSDQRPSGGRSSAGPFRCHAETPQVPWDCAWRWSMPWGYHLMVPSIMARSWRYRWSACSIM